MPRIVGVDIPNDKSVSFTVFLLFTVSISGFLLSGLWHHQQSKGHPFKKIVVLIQGPSWIAYFFISKIIQYIIVIVFIFKFLD